MKAIFENNPNLSHYYQVGERTFLPAYEQEAKDFARSTGQKVKTIKRPTKK